MEQVDEEQGAEDAGRAAGARGGGGMLAGLVVGVLLGAGLALLLAPDKGAKTRRRVQRRLRGAGEDTLQRLDDATLSARRDLLRRRKRLRKRLARGSAAVREGLADLL